MDSEPTETVVEVSEGGPEVSVPAKEGKEGDELGSASLSPASSHHARQGDSETQTTTRKRGRPTKAASSPSAPRPKRTAGLATNAEASSSRLPADETSTDTPGRRRPARATAARTYYEESSTSEEDEPEDELDPTDTLSPSAIASTDSLPFGADESYTPVKPRSSSHVPTGRKRGRPPGAKNKNPRPLKEGEVRRVPRAKREPSLDADGNPKPQKIRKPGSGRPKGSKNKSTLLKEAAARRREAEENVSFLTVRHVLCPRCRFLTVVVWIRMMKGRTSTRRRRQRLWSNWQSHSTRLTRAQGRS